VVLVGTSFVVGTLEVVAQALLVATFVGSNFVVGTLGVVDS